MTIQCGLTSSFEIAVCGQWLIVCGLDVDFMLLGLPHKLPPTQHHPLLFAAPTALFFFWPSCNSLDSLHHVAISDFYVFCFFYFDRQQRTRARPFSPLISSPLSSLSCEVRARLSRHAHALGKIGKKGEKKLREGIK